jgi:CRP-like cAMP-binding protein
MSGKKHALEESSMLIWTLANMLMKNEQHFALDRSQTPEVVIYIILTFIAERDEILQFPLLRKLFSA